MNAPVYALYDNNANSCLYIGGAFDDYYGILSANYPKWITLDYSTATFYSFSNTSGNGFFGGDVLTISKDVNGSNYIIVGGAGTRCPTACLSRCTRGSSPPATAPPPSTS